MTDYIDEKVSERLVAEHKFYDVWEEKWRYGPPDDIIEQTMSNVPRSKEGHYMGSIGIAQQLEEREIYPELIDDEHSVCSIGWCEKDQKYYGWSHRAIFGFGIGDKIFEEDFGDGKTPFDQHGAVTIETKEQARQSACNFAEHVG